MLAGAAAALRSAILTPLPASEAKRLDIRLASAHQALGGEAAAWFDRGYALPSHEAVGLVDPATEQQVQTEAGARIGVLSRREQQVAKLIAQGLSNRRIAERLALAPSTVQRHVTNILDKLGFGSRVQVALWVVTGEGRPAERQVNENGG